MTSQQLRALLGERGISQLKLADLCRVNPRTVRRWCETDRQELPRAAVLLICHALKIPLDPDSRP